jgi:phage-related protein
MIPILLDPSKSLSELVEDKTNGIGRLSVISECTVSEERNGAFTASFQLVDKVACENKRLFI